MLASGVSVSGIISDLFPRVEIPVVDYGIMEQSIRNMLIKRGYDDLYCKFLHGTGHQVPSSMTEPV